MKAGWEVKTLGEVSDFQGGGQPPKSEFIYEPRDGYIRMLQIRDFKSDERAVYIPLTNRTNSCVESDIMIGRYGASVGQIHRGKAGAYNVALIRTIPNSQIIDRDYFYYYLTSELFQQPLVTVADRSAQAGFSKQDISPFPIPLPPLDEQKQIVAVLDAAFEGLALARANTEANLQSARELFESYIEDAVVRSGGKPQTLQELLDNGSIVSHLDGNHGGLYPKKSEFVSEGIPYISANCIYENLIQMKLCKFLTPKRAATLRKGIAKNGDVIFAHNATVGPVALLETEEENVILSTSLTYYRCNPEKINPVFLMNAMRGAGFRRQYEAVMGQSTRNQVPITMQRTFTHTIPPLDEQKAIAEICVEIEHASRQLISHYRAKLADIDQLRQSLLQKAFAGELS